MVLTKKELGLLIKSARKLKSKKTGTKYTQKSLAKDIGKSQSYIGDIESGRTYPSFVLLNEIAEACDVNISFFMDVQNINDDIEKFIKLQIDNVPKDESHKMREEIKKDPEAKLNYIYECIDDGSDIINEVSNSPSNSSFKTPIEAIKNLLKQPVLMEFCELDINDMNDKDIDNFANDLLCQLKLISYKYKK